MRYLPRSSHAVSTPKLAQKKAVSNMPLKKPPTFAMKARLSAVNETPHAPVVEQVLVAAAFGSRAAGRYRRRSRRTARCGRGRWWAGSLRPRWRPVVLRRLVPGRVASLARTQSRCCGSLVGYAGARLGWSCLGVGRRRSGSWYRCTDRLAAVRLASAASPRGALLDRADPLVGVPRSADRLAVRRRSSWRWRRRRRSCCPPCRGRSRSS